MANFQHSLFSKRKVSKESDYVDVFGGPSNFPVSSFSSQMHDYTEIFSNFFAHKGSSSSIPYLDFPVFDEDEAPFDVRSTSFDYSDVFGDFKWGDFCPSFEEVFEGRRKTENHSENVGLQGGTGPTEQAPAIVSDLSTEVDSKDSFAGSEYCSLQEDGTSHHLHDGAKQFNISYNKTNQGCNEYSQNGTTHIAHLHEVPGFTVVVGSCSPSETTECDNAQPRVSGDLSVNADSNGEITEANHSQGMVSHAAASNCATQTSKNDFEAYQRQFDSKSSAPTDASASDYSNLNNSSNHLLSEAKTKQKQLDLKSNASDDVPARDQHHLQNFASHLASGGDESPRGDQFLTVSDINLQTQPSRLPPPSRPPPILGSFKGAKAYPDRACSWKPQRTMETYHSGFAYETQPLEENATHESPPFFDVEVDASSANAASAAAMREAMEKAQVKLKSAKESIDRKRDNSQSRTELRLNVDQRVKERGESRTCLQNNIFTEVQTREPCESRKNETVEFSMDGRWDSMNGTHVGPGFEHRMGYIELMNESIDKWQQKEYASPLDTHKLEERVGEWKVEKQFYELVNNDKPKVAQEVIEQKGNEKTLKRPAKVPEHKKNEKKAATEDDVLEINVKLKAVQEACEQEDNKQKVKAAKEVPEKEENVKKTISVQEAPEWGENEKKLKADEVTCECVQEKELKATKVTRDCEEACVGKKNETKLKTAKVARECEDNEMQLKAACQHEGEKKRLKVARECEEEEKELKAVHEHEEEGKRLQPVCVHEEEENIHKVTRECEEEGNRPKAIHEPEVDGKKSEVGKEAYESEGTKLPEFEENLKATQEASEREEDVKKIKADRSVCDYEEEKKDEAVRQVDEIEKEMAVEKKVCGDTVSEKKLEIGLEENNEGLKKVEDTNEVEEKVKKMKAANEVFSSEYTEQPSKIAGIANEQDEKGKIFQAKQGVGQWKGTENKLKETHKANGHKENENKINPTKKVLLQDGNGRKERAAQETYVQEASEKKLNYSHGAREQKENEKQSTETNAMLKSKNMNGVAVAFDREQTKSEFLAGFILGSDVGRKAEVAQSLYVSNGKAKGIREAPELTVIWDRKGEDKSQNGMYNREEREIEERTQRDRELEKERLRKIEEEREREREREKDRIAVERATREVRDRACEEARERSERAVVERVTAEARQRALAEARERAEKATIDAGRLRAERAAVERATAEAQERATEKALSERVVSREKPDGGMRQNYSFSGCHGTEDESAKRCKARLERHQRTVERAAKALAERNLRDILAQREQAERNRLAETLDADIRRWSNGKEGNLRALLSTLQYILGPESGWQPIPLTEVITAVAVKKAYRKATLCVHPDKVQQRGASIQQKYVCEKVFDLLKDAWNRFNSEER